MIRLEQVGFSYSSGYQVLSNISFEIQAGEHLWVYGKNGSGKTTLSMLLAGLILPTQGQVFFLERPLAKLSLPERAKTRLNIGIVAHWLPLIGHINALENCIQPLLLNGHSRSIAERKGRSILSEIGLGHRYRDPVFTFSDGEYSKLLTARACIHDPSLLLIDEPFAMVDQITLDSIHEFLNVRHQQGTTIVTNSSKPQSGASNYRTIELMDTHVSIDTDNISIGLDHEF